MKTSVYSIRKILFQGQAKSLSCKTAMGQIVVLDHHEPLISMLSKGVIKIVDAENNEHFIDVSSGFLHMNPANELCCIVE